LSGMKERAAIYRGTVVAAPAVGGWLVEARIPIPPVPPVAALTWSCQPSADGP